MKTILVIDDEKVITDIIQKILSKKYKVITENDGKQALKTIKNTDLDLIIADMIMPDVDGIALISHMKKTKTQTPILIMSGDPIGRKFLEAASILGAVERLYKKEAIKILLKW